MSLVHWLLVASLVVLATSTSDADVAWKNFKATHGKQYKNLREEMVRKQIFNQNFEKITAHNKLFQDGSVSYSLGINQYSDLTHAEISKTLNGYVKQSKKVSDIEIVEFKPKDDDDIPDEFDWREHGAVTPVKNQGQCGSCWAFSSTGALEGQYFLKIGKLVSISEQNLVDCSTDEYDNAGCYGGDMNPAFSYVHDNDGIDSEDSYPYEAENRECRYKLSANVTSLRGYANIPSGNEEFLKAAIATLGPIAVAIDASSEDFDFYESGVFYKKGCKTADEELDHAVLAVGYGTENGQDYWLIKNSWGTSWGEEGYIKMARNRNNNCGVATSASVPVNY